MKKVTATEMKNRLGQYLDQARSNPVMVEKSGRPTVVILSLEEYERLMTVEDAYWAARARRAEAEGYASPGEVADLIRKAGGGAQITADERGA